MIGSPPNLVLVSFLRDSIAEPYRVEISFLRWMVLGVPLTVTFLPVTWWVLTHFLFPIKDVRIAGGDELIRSSIRSLGRIKRGEWVTLVVFVSTGAAWITRPLLLQISWQTEQATVRPLAGLTDAGIALTAALILFVIPVDIKTRQFVMNWDTAQRLPWGILILFGGGLSLASAVSQNGVAEFIGSFAVSLAGQSPLILVTVVTAGVVFLTELTSNVATTAASLPILAALAAGVGIHPYLLVFPATLAASCAFMLPVATPPNAIVFGSGQVTLPQMVRAGVWLNMAAIVIVTGLAMTMVSRFLIIE